MLGYTQQPNRKNLIVGWEINIMANYKSIDVVEWLKKQVETKFAKDMKYTSTKVYLSCDRPHPDVIAECIKEDGERDIIRFLVV